MPADSDAIVLSSSTLSTWLPIIGSIAVNVATLIWGYAKLGSKVDRLEEIIGTYDGKLDNHVTDNKETCEKQEETIRRLKAERDVQIEKVTNETNLRMTKIEADQSQLKELLYHKIESVADGVNNLQAQFNKLQGYIEAKEEFDGRPSRARRKT